MPVGELLRRISSHELTEWMAFDALEAEAATVAPEQNPAATQRATESRIAAFLEARCHA
jgi:hypothetical protein